MKLLRVIFSALVLLGVGGTLSCRAATETNQAVVLASEIDGKAVITLMDGSTITVPPEQDQIGLRDIKISPDKKTVGWLVTYQNPMGPKYDALSGKLVIWRNGKKLHQFETEQIFYSWAFIGEGEEIAYHAGPAYGEQFERCERYKTEGGKMLAAWEGDLNGREYRPDWVKPLR